MKTTREWTTRVTSIAPSSAKSMIKSTALAVRYSNQYCLKMDVYSASGTI